MRCTLSSYKGSYAFTVTGFIAPPGATPGPFAVLGTFEADGKGNIKGSQTRNFNGSVVHETFTETYTMNSNCAGTSAKTTSTGIKTNWDFMMLDRGRTILAIETDKNNVVTLRAERM